jgi:hypothetical protein
MLDFPNPMVHDDMLDSLAYIDQLASPMYGMDMDSYGSIELPNEDGRPFISAGGGEMWEPLDEVAML